jgi:hypothetical protein
LALEVADMCTAFRWEDVAGALQQTSKIVYANGLGVNGHKTNSILALRNGRCYLPKKTPGRRCGAERKRSSGERDAEVGDVEDGETN